MGRSKLKKGLNCMNLLLLSGNSKRGKAWLEQVDSALAPQFDKTHRHDYLHWKNNEPEIDLDKEITLLTDAVKDLQPYMVFAKSAGSVLACKAIFMGTLQPESCLFVGFPMRMIENNNSPVDKWLKATNFPITILQHDSDPLGSYQEVERYFTHTNRHNVTIHMLPGATHDYLEFEIFTELLEKLN